MAKERKLELMGGVRSESRNLLFWRLKPTLHKKQDNAGYVPQFAREMARLAENPHTQATILNALLYSTVLYSTRTEPTRVQHPDCVALCDVLCVGMPHFWLSIPPTVCTGAVTWSEIDTPHSNSTALRWLGHYAG
ncbi:uncharacterized protein UTRI_02156 [Ustilago trichophora]|uniref:Uncharacterized protein n=1 Tax=Ustilago trichophora TaxID=86804 RepID=A0A5C3E1M5_9BASI|nr:uncharacterized protein UTRI_02156 [Ustilago trichophora]